MSLRIKIAALLTDIKSLERELSAMAENPSPVNLPKAEMELARKLCQAAWAAGKVSGDSILDAPSGKRFQRIEKMRQAAERAVEAKPKEAGRRKKGTSPLLSVLPALSAIHAQAALARRLGKEFDMVRKMAHILNFGAPGSQIKRMLSTYLN